MLKNLKKFPSKVKEFFDNFPMEWEECIESESFDIFTDEEKFMNTDIQDLDFEDVHTGISVHILSEMSEDSEEYRQTKEILSSLNRLWEEYEEYCDVINDHELADFTLRGLLNFLMCGEFC